MEERTRACDGCRIRKRKCDMLFPWCTNCQKSLVRDEQGNPVCTYSMVTKKRGPKKGYKDNLMKRLETLEGILKPLVEKVGGTVEQRIDSLTDFAIHSNEEDGNDENDAEISNSGTNDDLFTEKFVGYPQEVAPEATFPTLMGNIFFDSTENLPAYVAGIDAFQEPESLEVNLVRLGYLMSKHVELTSEHRKIILNQNPQIELLPICIKEALCANGVLYSTHPELFSSLLSDDQSGTAAKQAKIRMARMYIRRCEQSVQVAINAALGQIPNENWQPNQHTMVLADNQFDKCDTTRALLIVAMVSYGLGDGRKAMGYAREAYEFSHRYRLFHPFLFDRSMTQNTALTVDDLMFNVPPIGASFPVPLRDLTAEEKHERFILWASMLSIDTYASCVAGHNPNMDEFRFEHLIKLIPGYMKYKPSFEYASVQGENALGSKVGIHSIWEFGPFAVMAQDVKSAEILGTDLSEAMYVAANHTNLTLIIKRIFRAIRNGHRHIHQASDNNTPKLHKDLISWYTQQLAAFKPFESLEKFHNESPRLDLTGREIWRLRPLLGVDVFMLLTGLVWIHLPLVNTSQASKKMFELDLSSSNRFTSQECIMACFRAMCYLAKCLFTPITAEASKFPRRRSIHDNNLILAQEQPSPSLHSIADGMHIYIISAAALVSARSTYGAQSAQVESVLAEIAQITVPCLERITSIWPIGLYFLGKLRGLVDGGDSLFWAKEANKY